MTEKPQFFDPFDNDDNFKDVEKAKQAVQILTEQLNNGHGKSGFHLSTLLSPSCVLTTDEVKLALGVSHDKEIECFKKTYPVLLQEVEDGNGEAMHLIALYFQSGLPPVTLDIDKYHYWVNRAIKAGFRGIGQL